MSSSLGYIPVDDGYTEEGILHEVPGLYPRLEFSYRRLTSEDFADFLQQSAKLDERQATRLMASHLAGRVKRWSLVGPDGDAVPLTADSMRRLVRSLFVRLWRVVSGMEGVDEAPRSEEDSEADLADALQAAESGRPLATVREERMRKNSRSGSGCN